MSYSPAEGRPQLQGLGSVGISVSTREEEKIPKAPGAWCSAEGRLESGAAGLWDHRELFLPHLSVCARALGALPRCPASAHLCTWGSPHMSAQQNPGASPHTVPWALPAALPTSPLPASGRPKLLVTAKSHGQRDPRLQRARSCDRRAVSGRPCTRQCSEVRAGRQRRAPSCAAQKSPWNQHVY